MPHRPIVFSVAHSSAAKGAAFQSAPDAEVHLGIDEYFVSKRASEAAYNALAGDFPCALFDCGPLAPSDYDDAKVAAVNGLGARLAIELHCNASSNPGMRYSEVIYCAESLPGAEAAAVVARALAEGFQERHYLWPQRGARANSVAQDGHKLFFLARTVVPAIVVEGLFISNPEQAAWLADGGAEAYGLLVAEGVRRWLGGARG